METNTLYTQKFENYQKAVSRQETAWVPVAWDCCRKNSSAKPKQWAMPIQGSTKPYYHCLEQLKLLAGKKNEEQTPQVVLHTDQGSVYSSQAFRQAHEHYNILRSMSKAGTPTDNAIIEAINGWIKEELFLDFGLATAKDVPKLLDEYVHYYNYERPAAALGYKSPVQYKTELGF